MAEAMCDGQKRWPGEMETSDPHEGLCAIDNVWRGAVSCNNVIELSSSSAGIVVRCFSMTVAATRGAWGWGGIYTHFVLQTDRGLAPLRGRAGLTTSSSTGPELFVRGNWGGRGEETICG